MIAIDTPLGTDVLLLQSFTGHEAISRLFAFELDLLSENSGISFSDIVGQRVTISIKLADGNERYINGFVSRFAQSGSDENLTHYQAELVPWLWFLTRTANCRIFQNMSVPDVIRKVFADFGFSSACKIKLNRSYDPLDYCVQYRETAFNFVTRLMEQYGIFYFFEHDQNQHTLILGDDPSAHQPCPDQSKARCDLTMATVDVDDVVTGWRMEQELRTGKYSLTDYNFETPSTDLLASEPTVITVDGNTKYEIFDYPGEYEKKPQGTALAKTRMQEEEASYMVVSGTSTCRAFIPGYKFTLEDHYRDDMNTDYLLTEVQHSATEGATYTTGEGVEEVYTNHFTCIPAKVPFRPPRITLRPVVQGVQPALVVGKAGEEIWTDSYGRVKVHFYWDREGKQDENSSCWVRVSQVWAGKNWGAMFIPRIGQEVIVEFVEGDPDHPIITGRVYNAEQMPPGELPDRQNASGIRTRSTKGGGEHDANVFAFDDTKGSEMFYMRAQKNMYTRVENDDDLRVGNNQTEDIGHDRTTQINNDETTKIGHDKTLTVMNNRTATISGTDSETVAQSQTNTIGMSQTNQIGTSQTTTVGGTRATSVAGAETHSVAGMLSLTCGGVMSVTVGGVTTVTSGGPVLITAPLVLINGVLVVSQAIVSPIYTPGLGNFI